MGAAKVKAVYGLWNHLPDRAFRVLAFMALTVRDDDDPATFWAGREALCVGIGRIPPKAVDDKTRRERAAAFEAVRCAVKDLVDAGAITKVDGSGHAGRKAEYVLHLDPNRPRVSLPQKTQAHPGLRGRENLRKDPGSPCEKTQAHPAPKEEEEEGGHTRGATTGGRRQRTGDARETSWARR